MEIWNNNIHKALAHPLRRRIIECLRDKNLSFSELMKCAEVSNHGTIGFHLRSLGGLVALEPSTAKYHLTDRGKLAGELIQNIRFIASKAERDTKLTTYIRGLRLRDHAVLLHHTEDFKHRILFPFLEVGPSKDEAVVYLVSENKLDSEKREIQRYGIDLDRKDTFSIMSADEWYLEKGKAQAETIIANWLAFVEEKQKAGFKRVRAAAEMEVFLNYAKTKELFRYEQSLGRELPLNSCGLCLYNTNRLDEKQFIQVINCHRHIISKDVFGKTTV